MQRNYIEIFYGEDRDILILIHKSEYIKILVNRTSNPKLKLHTLCARIKKLITTTIRNVSGSMLHSLYTDFSKHQYKYYFKNYCFAFECYEHDKSNHLCIVSKNDQNPSIMNCLLDNTKKVDMKPEHQVWYGKVSKAFMLFMIFNLSHGNFVVGNC